MSGANFLQDSTERINKPPENGEYEVSVFGRGYGESIVLSCGNRDFIIVDSFINPDTGRPIALDYLDSMSIQYDRIKQVIITHWHDDHIRGISEIIQEAGDSISIILNPIVKDKTFDKYIMKAISEGGDNGASEIGKVFEYISKHENSVKISCVDKRVYADEEKNSAELYGLAPQDSEIMDYINKHIIKNISESVTAPYYKNDNELSLVLLLKKHRDGVLLGGDLENSNDDTRGWNAIVNNYTHTSTHPSLYKVPHHGSITGYNENVWKKILTKNPISVITVFNKNKKLPSKEEILKIEGLSKKVYIVGATQNDKELERKVEKSAPRVKVVSAKTLIGMYRYRKCMDSGKETSEVFGHVVVRDGITENMQSKDEQIEVINEFFSGDAEGECGALCNTSHLK